MGGLILAVLALAGIVRASVEGFDISNYQPNVNFEAAKEGGQEFVIVKATEGTKYVDSTFSSHYEEATNAGMIRGAYHFAHPGEMSGATQAEFFLENGGGWTDDGITLPGMLDLESENDGQCWGLSASAMVGWIKDFSNAYRAGTGRYPMLYTSPSWWKSCTKNSKAFATTNPLVLAHYSSSIGPLPGGWRTWTIWQNSDESNWGGDADVFNGDLEELKSFVTRND